MADTRFLTFRTNEQLYALPAEQVAEIIRLPEVARVPQAPRGLLGLANLRGNILPVASLRGLLGATAGHEPATRAIVLEGGAAPVALAVDVVDALVTVDDGKIETRQAELATRPGERLTGAFAADGKDAIARILDITALIDAAFVQTARPRPRRGLNDSAATNTITEAADRGQMLVSFEVAGQEYALPLDVVQEVLDAPQTLTALPSAENLVLGVAPFRDTLLPLLSLRVLLGFAPQPQRSGHEKVVVAIVAGTLVGLVADRMRTVFSADPDLIEDIPSMLSVRAGGEATIAAIFRGENGRRLVSLLSPERLFREDVMQRLRAGNASGPERETFAAQSRGEARGEERQFVVFRLGDDEFGVPIEAVNEVARVPDQITRLPRTPKFLEGVVNLRGDVLPVVDQRRRFDMPALEGQANRRLLVVRTERHRAGLIVDSVSEVLRCFADDIEPAPSLTNETVRLVNGVINLQESGRIVLLLDPAELLTRAERGLLDAFHAKTERARA